MTQNRNAQLTNDEKRTALEEMGGIYLLSQAANQAVKDRKIPAVTDSEIKQAITERLTQTIRRNPTTEEINAAFKESSTELKRELLITRYIQTEKKSLFDAVKNPTEAEIQKIYNDYKGVSVLDGGFFQPESVEARMLVVPFTNSSQKSTAQTTANNLSRRIGNDLKKFDTEDQNAQKTNPSSITGNEIIALTDVMVDHKEIRNQLGNAFVDAVLNLKQGQVSRVLEGPQGFYILKITRNVSASTPTLATARQAIINAEYYRRMMETFQKASIDTLAELKKKGRVTIVNDTYSKITW
jgi:parvulin-like peptidyl-prolyl isomerase